MTYRAIEPTVCRACGYTNGSLWTHCPSCKTALWETAPDFDVPHDGLEV